MNSIRVTINYLGVPLQISQISALMGNGENPLADLQVEILGLFSACLSIWLCATCECCTTRCPCNVDVTHIMDTLRIIARREGRVSEKDIKLFYDSFLDSMKHYGRMFEMGIILNYKLRSGHLMGDAELGPAMMSKGKIHLLPTKIKGADKVAKIFTRYQEKAKEKAKKNG